MKLSFKSFLGECFMLVPNINLWTGDDPDYAPHKYQLFFGWLFWGVRILFGKQHKTDKYCVRTIRNDYQNKSYYVLLEDWTTTSDILWCGVQYENLRFKLEKGNAPKEVTMAFGQCVPLDAVPGYAPLAAFDNQLDAYTIRDFLNRLDEQKKRNQWRIVETYRNMPLEILVQ